MRNYFFYLLVIYFFFSSCMENKEIKLFHQLSNSETGIYFSNDLSYDEDFNIFTYRNYFNGGGVGIIDINNDNLLDIYLTSNLTSNRLFLNLGNLRFREITEKAGVSGTKSWSTGVSIADVNSDGLIDVVDIVQLVSNIIENQVQNPDFISEDINPSSEYFGQNIGPSFFDGQVSCYYFGKQG